MKSFGELYRHRFGVLGAIQLRDRELSRKNVGSVIPNIIHHIWLGSDLPEHFRNLRQVQSMQTI
jgi:hypothetical protein